MLPMETNPSVYDVEAKILSNDLDQARTRLRNWLANLLDETASGSSTNELIELASRSPNADPLMAAYLLRCAGVEGLIPTGNGKNHTPRILTELCEKLLPRLYERLRANIHSQTFEKYNTLTKVDFWLQERLDSFVHPYQDLETISKNRHEISGALKDKSVQEYLRPFEIRELQSQLDDLLSSVQQICKFDDFISEALERSDRCLQDSIDASASRQSMFTKQYFDPLISRIKSARDAFLLTMRSDFSAQIDRASPNTEIPKRHPLHEAGRVIKIDIPLKNDGPGPAMKTKISISHADPEIQIDGLIKSIGTIPRGAFSVAIDAEIVEPSSSADIIVDVEWTELGSSSPKSDSFDFTVRAQKDDIDWERLEYRQPYVTEVAEGDRFIGRSEKVRNVARHLLNEPMTPFYITGQKRVGKTSLIKAVTALAEQRSTEAQIASHYILWGNVAHVSPTDSMRELGKSIEGFIVEHTDGTPPTGTDYGSSLSNIVRLLEHAKKRSPKTKFVCIIDEFDEIHEELFLSGNLAATFFANLRAISRQTNFCLCLVGGENMPFLMERQGQKLNNFARIDLNYYSREEEWSDFEQLVRSPTNETLHWHDEAISHVFNETNGNPYFANLICAGVYKSAVSDRDADITEAEVSHAINREISSLGANSFAHLWQDGIPKAADEREPDILRRMRVLVALARCLIVGTPPTLTNIADHRASGALPETEILPVLHDFIRRNVLTESEGEYHPILPLFARWLRDAGVSHLVADHLNDEIADTVLERENEARVRSDEVVSLVDSWPTYLGKKIGVDDVKSWLEQTESAFDQRLLFKILKRTKVYSEAHIRERLGNLHRQVLREIPTVVRTSQKERRRDVIVTYVDGPAKSGASYAALYAENNLISSDLVFEAGNFAERLREHRNKNDVSAIVIIDDIIGTGKSMVENLGSLLEKSGEEASSLKIFILAITSTSDGHRYVENYISKLDGLDISLFIEEVLTEKQFAFPESGAGWDNRDERERANALCRDLGSYIYKRSPFGYGNMGLLVVFPATVPNNTLPILHSPSKKPKERSWKPLFPRPVN